MRPTVGAMHVAVMCRDLDESLRFYREGLGFHRVHEWEEARTSTEDGLVVYQGRAVCIELCGTTYIELYPGGGESVDGSACPLQHIGLAVKNVDETYRRCLAAGGETLDLGAWHGEPRTAAVNDDRGTKARIAFVKGPAGEIVQLYQPAVR